MDVKTATFKPRARLMLLLGDELIRDAGIAVFELVKNAYDANATVCGITLHDVCGNSIKAKITVRDNGCGMNIDTIMNIWLEPGTENRKKQKLRKERTPKPFSRIPLGEKGVGRFAVHKLGQKATMITRAANSDEIVVNINWQSFSGDKYISEVPVEVITRTPEVFTESKTGTLIEIGDLREQPWNKRRIRALYRAINSICSPFKYPESFKPSLTIIPREQEDCLKGLLSAADIIEQAPFHFHGTIINDTLDYTYEFIPRKDLTEVDRRKSKNTMFVRELGRGKKESIISLPANEIGQIDIDFYIFDRTPQILKLTSTDVQGVRKYLNSSSGIRVYQDGIRVYDYGEPGNDWLNLSGRRVNDPAVRIGNNQIIGIVMLTQEGINEPTLVAKTNREGFVENEAYKLFHDAIQFALQQATTERNIDKERIRIAYSTTIKKEPVTDDLEVLRSEVQKLSLEPELGPIIDRIEKQYKQITERLIVAASAGLNLSVIMHEVEKGIHTLLSAIKNNTKHSQILSMANQLSNMVDSLTWLVRSSARGKIKVSSLIEHAINMWEVRYQYHDIEIENALLDSQRNFTVIGYRRSLLMALMNIVDNAIYWLGSRAEDRKLYFGISNDNEGKIEIVIADNGPGFVDSSEYITEPFFTRKPDGMGLGLYIANEVMKQQNGLLRFPETGEVLIPPEYTGAIVMMQLGEVT